MRYGGTMGLKKKAIKISVTQHHHLYDTNDLVKFRIDGMNFNICRDGDV